MVGTEVPVHYARLLASMVSTFDRCLALAVGVYRISMVQWINRLHPVLSADFLDRDRFVLF